MPAQPLPAGPKGVPIFGQYMEYRRDPLGAMSRWVRDYGDVVAVRFGPIPVVTLAHPDAIEEVLVTKNKHFRKGLATRSVPELLGNGLVTSDGDFWRRQRRLAQPAFHRERLAGYAQVMVDFTERLLTTWRPGEIRDLHTDMMRLTMEIVAKTLFDTDIAAAASDLGPYITTALVGWDSRLKDPPLLPYWVPTPRRRRFARAVDRLDEIVYGFIRSRRQSGHDPGDLLSMLIAARDDEGSGMTDQQLRDECMTLFLAGHETTANALAWAFHLLATHPDVLARLAAEVDEVLAGRAPTIADLPRLTYTDAVLTEAMRLRPPIWGITREAVDCVEIAGYQIPAGTQISLIQWITHRDPRWFPEPERFHPDRWLDGLAKRLPAYAYFPFGGGPRLCIGKSFALMEGVLLLATIAQRFHVTPAPSSMVEVDPSVTLRPRHGLPMVVGAR